MEPQSANDINIEKKIEDIHELMSSFLVAEGVSSEKISHKEIMVESVLYMVYWFHRLKNNPEEQGRIKQNLIEYIGHAASDKAMLAEHILSNISLKEPAKEYAESLLHAKKTVDLVITKIKAHGEKEILCTERSYYPLGLALPGGIVRDTDEDNPLDVPAHVFTALRVAGEKVLHIPEEDIIYLKKTDEHGKEYFAVQDVNEIPQVRLYLENEGGYSFRENIKSVLRPSDPRHIVDTVAFKCEIEGEPRGALVWKEKSEIMLPELQTGGLAFGHHREIIAQITAQSSVEKERGQKEREFIRSIIKEPFASYESFKTRFENNKNSPETSFQELFPIVDHMLSKSFKEEINALCKQTPVLAGIRDKMVISLRHVSLKNRTFCPYLSTLRAIADGIAFFDVVARHKKGFYETMVKDTIVEHDPRTTPHASYHMYRYKYRFNGLLNMIPGEIIIPTYEPLSATDLMRVRGVPIRFVGLSDDFLYVDEFEQSPEEFFMHDCNHSWRMAIEDQQAEKKYGRTKQELIQDSNAFIQEYLEIIKIRTTDTEEQKEMKKLKKIILFEIVHEDARPFLKEIICRFIQVKEGAGVPFEVPRIDTKTGYIDVVDTIDTGISTLSYVRNKLQHGFYDQVDAQLPQIVGPKYRRAEWIARAAYEMLVELDAVPASGTDLDETGHVSLEWLLRRTCAVGPDNIHNTEYVDPDMEKYGDGAEKLNPKRYQAGK